MHIINKYEPKAYSPIQSYRASALDLPLLPPIVQNAQPGKTKESDQSATDQFDFVHLICSLSIAKR